MASALDRLSTSLAGTLFFGGEDAWTAYRTFLHEERAGGTRNYSALLAPSTTKAHKAVSYREEDGERLPDTVIVRLEPRDITLHFALVAEDVASFLTAYDRVLRKLRRGVRGYTDLRIPEMNKVWRLVYLSGGDYQLSGLDGSDLVVGRFAVKFREPKPAY